MEIIRHKHVQAIGGMDPPKGAKEVRVQVNPHLTFEEESWSMVFGTCLFTGLLLTFVKLGVSG